MRNDLDLLPWQPTQLFRVENYLEAAGVVAALRAGIAPSSVTRPLELAHIERLDYADQKRNSTAATNLGSATGISLAR